MERQRAPGSARARGRGATCDETRFFAAHARRTRDDSRKRRAMAQNGNGARPDARRGWRTHLRPLGHLPRGRLRLHGRVRADGGKTEGVKRSKRRVQILVIAAEEVVVVLVDVHLLVREVVVGILQRVHLLVLVLGLISVLWHRPACARATEACEVGREEARGAVVPREEANGATPKRS